MRDPPHNLSYPDPEGGKRFRLDYFQQSPSHSTCDYQTFPGSYTG